MIQTWSFRRFNVCHFLTLSALSTCEVSLLCWAVWSTCSGRRWRGRGRRGGRASWPAGPPCCCSDSSSSAAPPPSSTRWIPSWPPTRPRLSGTWWGSSPRSEWCPPGPPRPTLWTSGNFSTLSPSTLAPLQFYKTNLKNHLNKTNHNSPEFRAVLSNSPSFVETSGFSESFQNLPVKLTRQFSL